MIDIIPKENKGVAPQDYYMTLSYFIEDKTEILSPITLALTNIIFCSCISAVAMTLSY